MLNFFPPVKMTEICSYTYKKSLFANPLPSPVAGTGGALPSSKPHPLSLDAACADGTPPPPLQLGDRVVWISDSGPEYGEVKWLGKLLDVGADWMVGVEFVSSFVSCFIFTFCTKK